MYVRVCVCVSRAVLLYSPVCGVCIVSYCCLVRGVPNRPLHLCYCLPNHGKLGKGMFRGEKFKTILKKKKDTVLKLNGNGQILMEVKDSS